MPDIGPLWFETLRDWVIIFMGIAFFAFFFVSLIIAIVIGLLARGILSKASSAIDEGVRPTLANAKETSSNLRGTASYISDAAVTPVIRTYGMVAGVRRAIGVIAGLVSPEEGRK